MGRRGVGARRLGTLWVAVLALGVWLPFAGPVPGARAGEPAVSVVDWLEARGEDASFEARLRRFRAHFPGEIYRGTAEQNLRLLDVLQGAGWRATLDRSTQVLRLDLPEDVVWAREAGAGEAPVLAALPGVQGEGLSFVSAAVLGVKAKIFDDGLVAAVEITSRSVSGGGGPFPRVPTSSTS